MATGLYDLGKQHRTRRVLEHRQRGRGRLPGLADYEDRVAKGKYYMHQNEDSFYIQDNWRANNRLTLNLGLRWQFSPYPNDKYYIMSGFDLKNMSIVLGNTLENFYKIGAARPGLIAGLKSYGMKFETSDQASLPKRLVNNNWYDVGPHVGFAYRAFDGQKSFVLRGAFSTSYFPVPIYGWNDTMRLNAPFTGFYGNTALTSAAQSPDGKRNWALVGVPTVIAGKNSTNAVDINGTGSLGIGGDSFRAAFFDPNQPSARVYDWNLTLEKQVWNNTLLRVAYIGNHAANQDSYQDLNQQIPFYVWYKTTGLAWPDNDWTDALTRPLDNPSGATDVAKYPYGDLQMYGRDGWSNSNGAQVELERRFAGGYGFQLFYNMVNVSRAAGHGWYDATDPVSSYLPGTVPTDLHARMKLLMYARDISVPQHEVRWNWLVELPFGKGKPLFRDAGRVLNQFVGGWQISGMGRLHSNYFLLPTDVWPTGNKLEYYGHKYPIQDCRSGECQAGWLLYNGYIPAHQINQPDGIMGVPANYKPAAEPVWPYPANYNSLQGDNPSASNYDPNYGRYGSNTELLTLKDGSVQEVDKGDLHPWRNQPILSSMLWNMDASIFKSFQIKESLRLRLQGDFFNLFNHPDNDFTPVDDTGVVSRAYGMNAPRVVQLSLRLTW